MESGRVAAEKARMRGLFRQRRALLGNRERERQSSAICERLVALVRQRAPRVVSATWPLAEEVDLRPAFREILEQATLALPIVMSARGEAPRLIHRVYQGEDSLARGRFGVMEPLAENPEIAPEAIDLAIVPALAVDIRGTRLGYGGGFYDAFLSTTGALRVATVFASGEVETLPAEAHDARVDVVVTPEAVRETSQNRNPSEPTA